MPRVDYIRVTNHILPITRQRTDRHGTATRTYEYVGAYHLAVRMTPRQIERLIGMAR